MAAFRKRASFARSNSAHSASVYNGSVMSPTTLKRSASAPSLKGFAGGSGTTLTIGTPRLVTTTSCRVRLTRSITSRQRALNSAAPIARIVASWSECTDQFRGRQDAPRTRVTT